MVAAEVQHTSEEPRLASGLEILARNKDRLAGLGQRIQFNFMSQSISRVSKARADAKLCESVTLDARTAPQIVEPAEKPDCIISIGVEDFARVCDGELEPRLALFGEAIRVDGDPSTAVKLGDMLQGRSFATSAAWLKEFPAPTPDLAKGMKDFENAGYGIVRDVIDADQLAQLRERLDEQAAGETASGVAVRDGGPALPSQRVWNLINKGRVFQDLLSLPIVQTAGRRFLGENFHIWSYSANIAGPGSVAQPLHMDQTFAQPSIPIRLGMNFVFFLDDLTSDNGGTRLIPGSQNGDVAPSNPLSTEGTIGAQGPAGSVLMFDSRLWHGTGANRTDRPRRVLLLFCVRYFIRPQENAFLVLDREVEDNLSDDAKTMLGFRCTNGVGAGEQGPKAGFVSRVADPIIALTRQGRMIPYVRQEPLVGGV